MANLSESSSSLSFSSPSSINNNITTSTAVEARPSLDAISLAKLSSNLELLLTDSTCDYSDADIVVEGISVGVHRCILASRSEFFNELFRREKGFSEKEGKPKYCLNNMLPYGKVGYEAFLILLSYLYTGKLKPFPVEVSTCVDNACAHDACGPAISFTVELMYALHIFQVPELVSIFQRRLSNFVDKAFVEDVIPILAVAFHCQSSELVAQCVDRIARSDLDSMSIEKELPYEVVEKIKLLRKKPASDDENNSLAADPLREKRIRSLHKALDSDDVELVKLLLTESAVTLDDANALHYIAAYCDTKVVSEVLGLGLADVNLRNSRGYTILHIAAMRREPSIIVSLLDKGASARDLTWDERSAVSICRRLTRPKDYHAKVEQGQETNKYRLCIDVLEREMWRNPLSGVAAISSHPLADDLQMKLLYLENRVAFARLFFPAEAKLAMETAYAEITSGITALSLSKVSGGNLREVDLNETPLMQNKRLLGRLEALKKTVEKGRRYFPHCSEVLDKFMEDDLPDLFYLERGNQDEQRIKRARFMELKDDVQKAFNKDKAEKNNSGLTSSSSSSSLKRSVNNKLRYTNTN